ncbi:hypothetical protein Acr_20g0002350 [Actinidia rufa]|uniref:ZFYVE26-like TPR repeats domain-containing protein n=1 Tax=Actinidia rufa TaxID=165716 RepID=A0A7J0GCA6_9ERIC|nr:hypothetical protein Acr_20g0002350 [Actinidia rufa]
MAQRGRRRGGRGLLPNVGDGFDVNPLIGRKNGNSNQWDEIEELRRQVATLTEMAQCLQPSAEGSDGSEDTHFENLLQERKSVFNFGQHYHASSKFGQHFQSYSNPGSLTSFGKSGSFENGVPNRKDKLAAPAQYLPHFSVLEARNPSQNGEFKALFVEKEMVQYCDDNVEQYCNNVPVFDKAPNDGIEEDEAITLMILDTFFTPKQHGEEVIKEDDEESHEDNHTLGLCPKVQDVCEVTLGLCPKVQEVACEAPPTIEDLIESKVEKCFQDLPSKRPLVPYTQRTTHLLLSKKLGYGYSFAGISILLIIADYNLSLRSTNTSKEIALRPLPNTKVLACVVCGRLKSAFQLASRSGSVADVQYVAHQALHANALPVLDMCKQWLAQYM